MIPSNENMKGSAKVLQLDEENPAARHASEASVSISGDDYGDFGVDYAERKSGIFGTTLNITNTIIGAGILSLASVVGECGYVIAAILFFIGGIGSMWAMHIMFIVLHKFGGDQLSFGRIAGQVNVWFPLIVTFLQFLCCLLVAILYLTISGDFLVAGVGQLLPKESDSGVLADRQFWVLLVFGGFCVPLSIPHKISILKYSSGIAVIMIMYSTALVLYYASQSVQTVCGAFLEANNLTECVGELCCTSTAPDALCCIGEIEAATYTFKGLFSSIAVIISAFCCSIQAPNYYNDITDPTIQRLNTASTSGISLTLVLYFLISFGGYFTYGANVNSDLLSSYPDTTQVAIARIGIGFVTTVSYPLLFHPARDSFIFLITQSWKLATGKTICSPGSKASKVLYVATIIGLSAITLSIGLMGLSVGSLLNIIGSITITSLMFIVPGIFYLSLIAGPKWDFTKVSAVGMIIFGALVMVINIILWFV